MARPIALFNESIEAPRTVPFKAQLEDANSDIYLSTAYPTLALYLQDEAPSRLRSQTWSPYVFREWLLNKEIPGDPKTDNTIDANTWTGQVLKDVRARLEKGDDGIFTPAFESPDGINGPQIANGDGVSVTRFISDDNFKTLSGFNKPEDVLRELGRAITKGLLAQNQFDIQLGRGNDIVLPGWQGNSTTRTGPGNDIILSSPQLHIATWYDYHLEGKDTTEVDDRFWDAYVYYPTPYAAKGTEQNREGNTYRAGSGADLIYYDSGVKRAEGDDGNDTFAPSLGSFNWGLDSLIHGEYTGLPPDNDNDGEHAQFRLYAARLPEGSITTISDIKTFIRDEKALISPLKLIAQEQRVNKADTRGYDFGVDGTEFDAFNSKNDHRVTIRTSNKGATGVNFGLSKNDNGIFVTDKKEINIIGGSKLVGGLGNDLFYGIDPDFYRGFRTPGWPLSIKQGLRVAFSGEPANGGDHPESEVALLDRYNVQRLQGVDMYGGPGTDYFALGNIRNLTPWDVDPAYDYIYWIYGNSDEYIDKKSPLNKNAQADIFDVNLTYAGNNWKNGISSAPDGSSQEPTADELANLGFDALDTFSELAGVFTTVSPVFGAISSLGSFAINLVGSLFSKEEDKKLSDQQEESSYYQDPIGEWRKQVIIQDWDPSDSILISVDPSDPSADPTNRWNAFDFRFREETDNDLLIRYTEAGTNKTEKTLFRLDTVGQDSGRSGAWFAWNFYTNQYDEIGADNLATFGNIELTKEKPEDSLDLKKYNDTYDFEVPQGQRLFRWNDSTLSQDNLRLQSMRERSNRIAIQYDTGSNGYYWQPVFKGNITSSDNQDIQNLELDYLHSKLWYADGRDEKNKNIWKSFTYEQLDKNPDLQELKIKATPQWSLTNPETSAADRITGFQALGEEMKGDLDALVLAESTRRPPLPRSRGRLLPYEHDGLTNLNQVTDIVTQGGEDKSFVIVYHKPLDAGSKYALLKTVVDDNTIFRPYGLTSRDVRKEESGLGQDLDLDGVIGLAPTNAAG